MEQYLKKEKELLECTDSDFFDHRKVITHWYSVKDEVINKHNKLVNAIGVQPQYLILSRYETEHPGRRITVYFNNQVAVIPFIPFGEWKLFDNTEQFGRHKYYTVQDPTGILKTISLTEYIPYIPQYLKPYLKFGSFEEFEKSGHQGVREAVQEEKKPIEISLKPGENYLISISVNQK
jgi:hypothetical protein